jgi:imidazolonepropionase-like amidohydrolase
MAGLESRFFRRRDMRKLLLFLCLMCAAAFAQQSVDVQPLTVVTAANLLDGRSREVLHNRAVVIRGDKIVRVTGLDDPDVKGAPVKYAFGPDVTVMPGMIESHTHIFLQGEDPAKGGYDANLL